MTSERRRGPRVPLRIWASSHEGGEVPVWIGPDAPPGDFAFCYSTRDLSVTGLFLESEPPLAVGVELDVELALPGRDEPLRLRGRVVRAVASAGRGEEKPGVGVEFVELGADALAVLREFVAAQEAS